MRNHKSFLSNLRAIDGTQTYPDYKGEVRSMERDLQQKKKVASKFNEIENLNNTIVAMNDAFY